MRTMGGHKRFRMLTALMLAAMLALAACSGSGSKDQPEPKKEEPAKTEPAKQASTTLVWGRGADSVGLDPINETDGESLKVTHQIYDTLLEYKPGGTEVQASLATEWSASADGLEWTIKLRQGVKFHDGSEFDAEAVKLNFDRWRDTKHPGHKGGDFAYYQYMFGGFDDKSVIKEVQVVDKHTVKFVLRQIQASFLQDLAMDSFAIASPKAIKEDPESLKTKPVGTGPFIFESWAKGDKIVLKANKEYWGGAPKLEQLIFRSIPDNNARLVALRADELDIMDGIDPAFLPVIKDTGKFDIAERPAMNVGYLAFNMDKKPFDDVRIRRAINHAINRDELNRAFYGGLGTPSVSPLPPAVWGHNPDVPKYEFSVEKGRKLMEEAGYSKDKPLKTQLWVMPVPRPYMPQPEKIGVAIQTYLREIYIDAEIVTMEWGTYLDKTGVGEHTMALLGWTGDNGDPDNFLYVLLDKDQAKGPDAGNIAFYKSDAVHDLLIKARTTTDQAKRTQLYKEAQKLIQEDAPWASLMHAKVPIAVRKGITGYVPSPMGSESLAKVAMGPK